MLLRQGHSLTFSSQFELSFRRSCCI